MPWLRRPIRNPLNNRTRKSFSETRQIIPKTPCSHQPWTWRPFFRQGIDRWPAENHSCSETTRLRPSSLILTLPSRASQPRPCMTESRGSPTALTNFAMVDGPFSVSTCQMTPAISPICATQETGVAVAIEPPHFTWNFTYRATRRLSPIITMPSGKYRSYMRYGKLVLFHPGFIPHTAQKAESHRLEYQLYFLILPIFRLAIDRIGSMGKPKAANVGGIRKIKAVECQIMTH